MPILITTLSSLLITWKFAFTKLWPIPIFREIRTVNKSSECEKSNSMDLFTESNSEHADNCSYTLSSLDFLPEYNATDIPNLEIQWPCEVRAYWVQIIPFVSAVKFLLTYVTLVIIIIGKLTTWFLISYDVRV